MGLIGKVCGICVMSFIAVCLNESWAVTCVSLVWRLRQASVAGNCVRVGGLAAPASLIYIAVIPTSENDPHRILLLAVTLTKSSNSLRLRKARLLVRSLRDVICFRSWHRLSRGDSGFERETTVLSGLSS